MVVINFKEYQFLFANIICHSQAIQQLRLFMHRHHNSELIDFCVACFNLVNESKYQLLPNVQKVYDTYVRRNSAMQVNVSAEDVRRIDELMVQFEAIHEDHRTGEIARSIFYPGLVSILHNIETNTFPRFVRSDQWLKWVKTNCRSLRELEQLAVHRSQLHQLFITCNDEERTIMTGKDIAILNNLQRDGIDWHLFHSNKHKGKYVDSFMVFQSRLNALDDECTRKYGKTKAFKCIWQFNCPSIVIFKLMYSKEHYAHIFSIAPEHNEPRLIHVDDSQNINVNAQNVKFNSFTSSLDVNYGIPFMKTREMHMCGATLHNPETGTIYDVLKPIPASFNCVPDTTSPETQTQKTRKVPMRFYLFQVFQDLGENKCQLITVYITNRGGKIDGNSRISKWLNRATILRGIVRSAQSKEEVLDWYYESGRPELTDMLGKFQLMHLNKSIARSLPSQITTTLSDIDKRKNHVV